MARPLSEWSAITSVMRRRWRRSFVLPNYTPQKWWECDVFEITHAGYFVEYEVKLSLSDFRNDALKRRGSRWLWDEQQRQLVRSTPGPTKHELLASGTELGPSRFYFVVPKGLLGDDELPQWAGLIELWDLEPRVSRTAPRLHGRKFDDARATHARSICYYRMHEAFQRSP